MGGQSIIIGGGRTSRASLPGYKGNLLLGFDRYFIFRKEVFLSKPADSAFSMSVRLSITSLSFKEEM